MSDWMDRSLREAVKSQSAPDTTNQYDVRVMCLGCGSEKQYKGPGLMAVPGKGFELPCHCLVGLVRHALVKSRG